MSSNTDQQHDDSSLTMMDILEEQEALQEDADAVLGAGDDEHCTYDQGHVPRQAVYACLTCSPVGGAGGRAGVCLACSLHCHATHNLVELYTKRDFRCDCGNEKFIMQKCKLTTGKDASNPRNSYSQNYDGVYCSCHRPYPDPDHPDDEDEMIQCCACEDWHHASHLGEGLTVPAGEQYAEMVCPGCVARLPFLQRYTALSVCVVSKSDEDDGAVDVMSAPVSDAGVKGELQEKEGGAAAVANDEKKATNDESSTKTGCSAGQWQGAPVSSRPLFFPEDWRTKLCTCDTCTEERRSLGAAYLNSSEDTISHYEHQSRQRAASGGRTSRERSVEREFEALNSVDRVTRTEMVAEYNTLSTELREYLRKFAETGKVVRDEDIREFFTGLQARKKQRGNDGMPPNSCKW